jgi:hypothetical protein
VILLLVAAGAFMLMNSSPEQNAGDPSVVAKNFSSASPVDAVRPQGAEKNIEVFLTEGRADVYRDDGQLLGTTPYKLNVRVGERIKLKLKRDGYNDETVDFIVSESKRDYAFKMTR